MPLRYRTGDLFHSDEQTIVNTVNCVGVMGKGIALQFKKLYPRMFQDYVERCSLPSNHPQKVVTGKPYVFEEGGKLIINFPTKNHWRYPSKISYIEDGLAYFVARYQEWEVSSIAFPLLGCENGGLDWRTQVQPIMERHLAGLDIPVVIVLRGDPSYQLHDESTIGSLQEMGQIPFPGLAPSPSTRKPKQRSKATRLPVTSRR